MSARNMTLGVEPELKDKIKRLAKASGLSQAAYCLALLGHYIPTRQPIFRKKYVLVSENPPPHTEG